ncbi:11890_t:CDS:2 [Ambispora leptoticha]|uniref:11890_t:CDS:1 n=1 Tax=Ambispora leptoticha TaxID=144679 RepID=A0A9N9CE85_9GLOM|nr:11890_t:CDS:2 [Ambispora leptoticha]
MRTVSIHKLFKKLNEHCLNIISEEPHMIFEANDFLSLEESVLVSILKRDDLGMDEIEIWNSIIKWGTGNTLSLSKEPVSKWTPENFAALEKTLHQCIPLIRYSDISSTDYFEKVMPYRKIIPKDMKTEILGYHLKDSTPQPIKILPPRSGSFDSKIINLKHTNYLNAPDAFIFSFDKNDLQSAKISRNNSGNQIAYRYNNYQVDDHYFNENLYISDNCNLYASSWYYHRDMEESQVNFKVDEYEVFQIVPKDHAK